MALDWEGLNLGGVNKKPSKKDKAETVTTVASLEIPLNLIDEDEGQPRKEFDEQAMQDLIASIKEHGVLQAISVRENSDKKGRFIVNLGARRLRAARAAGFETIPAIVSNSTDDYAQVVENEQRQNLSLKDLVFFIKKKIDEGAKQTQIAKRLSKSKSTISELVSLGEDLPEELWELYVMGNVNSQRTFYDLVRLYKKHPSDTLEWARTINPMEEITRHRIKFQEKVYDGEFPKLENSKEDSAVPSTDEDVNVPDQVNEVDKTPETAVSVSANIKPAAPAAPAESEDVDDTFSELEPNPDDASISLASPIKATDSSRIKYPCLLGFHESRPARVLLKMPEPGFLWIKYDDDNAEDHVLAELFRINQLIDSKD